MVGVGEDDDLALGGEHPRPDRGTLASVGDRQEVQPGAAPRPARSRLADARGGLRTRLDEARGPVGAAVVHDEDPDEVGPLDIAQHVNLSSQTEVFSGLQEGVMSAPLDSREHA
jgi:hypothetical protein